MKNQSSLKKKKIHVLSKDDIKKVNSSLLDIYKDDDFKTLIKIYYTKPELFDYLSKFLSCGNIVEDIDNNSDDDESFDYEEEYKILKNINEDFSGEILKAALNKFNGHINMVLRYLLCIESLNENDI